MSLVKTIKMLCDERKVTFAEVEREIAISNGQIRRWDNASPKSETLSKVADYFHVSTDFLLGRTDKKYLELKNTTESDADKKLHEIFNGLNDQEKEFLLAALNNTLELAKSLAKK